MFQSVLDFSLLVTTDRPDNSVCETQIFLMSLGANPFRKIKGQRRSAIGETIVQGQGTNFYNMITYHKVDPTVDILHPLLSLICRLGRSSMLQVVTGIYPRVLLYQTPNKAHDYLGQAVLSGDLLTIETLLEAGVLPDRGEQQELVNATIKKNIFAMKVLLAAGADPNRIVGTGRQRSPVSVAVGLDLLDHLKTINEHSTVPISSKNIPYFTKCSIPMLDYLAEKVPGIDNNDLLVHYAKLGNSEAVEHLVYRYKTDIETVDDMDRSALFHAVVHDDGDMVLLLLGAGADPYSEDWYGKTPLDVAVPKSDTYYVLRKHLLGEDNESFRARVREEFINLKDQTEIPSSHEEME